MEGQHYRQMQKQDTAELNYRGWDNKRKTKSKTQETKHHEVLGQMTRGNDSRIPWFLNQINHGYLVCSHWSTEQLMVENFYNAPLIILDMKDFWLKIYLLTITFNKMFFIEH